MLTSTYSYVKLKKKKWKEDEEEDRNVRAEEEEKKDRQHFDDLLWRKTTRVFDAKVSVCVDLLRDLQYDQGTQGKLRTILEHVWVSVS